MFKEEKGITLVALVVTIIVLLILAGVTLTLVLGQQGLIGKAQTSSNTWANATRDEMTKLNTATQDTDNQIAQYVNSYNAY